MHFLRAMLKTCQSKSLTLVLPLSILKGLNHPRPPLWALLLRLLWKFCKRVTVTISHVAYGHWVYLSTSCNVDTHHSMHRPTMISINLFWEDTILLSVTRMEGCGPTSTRLHLQIALDGWQKTYDSWRGIKLSLDSEAQQYQCVNEIRYFRRCHGQMIEYAAEKSNGFYGRSRYNLRK